MQLAQQQHAHLQLQQQHSARCEAAQSSGARLQKLQPLLEQSSPRFLKLLRPESWRASWAVLARPQTEAGDARSYILWIGVYQTA